METPNDWDTMKLVNAIEKIRNTWDAIEGKLRIRSYSTEELKINLDVANNLIQQPHTLNTEMKNFVEDVLRTANVDTNKASDIKITLDILEKSPLIRNSIVINHPVENREDIPNTLQDEKATGKEDYEEGILPFERTIHEDESKKENPDNRVNSQRENGCDPSNPSLKNVIGSPLIRNSIVINHPVENKEDIPNTLQDEKATGKEDYEEAEMSFERILDEDVSKIENPSEMSNPAEENLIDIRYLAEKKKI
ncbi:unnamed protein product [Mytilus edulis]|uniref:Uncharacterized protein n=1 Tax=Mytilus edulis TaxID=6550 RepID=A0A8S3QZK6_MYTED|nr:unnamed protein product [Mytilus edulis]